MPKPKQPPMLVPLGDRKWGLGTWVLQPDPTGLGWVAIAEGNCIPPLFGINLKVLSWSVQRWDEAMRLMKRRTVWQLEAERKRAVRDGRKAQLVGIIDGDTSARPWHLLEDEPIATAEAALAEWREGERPVPSDRAAAILARRRERLAAVAG